MHILPVANTGCASLLIGAVDHHQDPPPVDELLPIIYTFLSLLHSSCIAPTCMCMVCFQIRYQAAGRRVKPAAPMAPLLLPSPPHPTCLGDKKCGWEPTHATPRIHTGNLSCQHARESPGEGVAILDLLETGQIFILQQQMEEPRGL